MSRIRAGLAAKFLPGRFRLEGRHLRHMRKQYEKIDEAIPTKSAWRAHNHVFRGVKFLFLERRTGQCPVDR